MIRRKLKSFELVSEARYIEYLLGVISTGHDNLTLSQIRSDFKHKFAARDEKGTLIQEPPCIFPNQYTVLLSLLPFIWLHEANTGATDGENLDLDEASSKQIKLIRV